MTMLILIALSYFCLACTVIWFALFPIGRRRLGSIAAATMARLALRWRGAGRARRGAWRAARARTGGALARQVGAVRRHWRLVAAIAALIAIPSVLALLVIGPGQLPGYEPFDPPSDDKVAALLMGEQLAPPAALPPMAFSTLEVEQIRPLLGAASRNWELLDADFSQRLLRAFKIMKERHGYDMALLEGYRSPARQDLLARMGSAVTSAAAFQSWHQYGLAADCAFWRDGRLAISEKDAWTLRGYRLYGEIAESLGLHWGGRWAMMDLGHTELRRRGVMRGAPDTVATVVPAQTGARQMVSALPAGSFPQHHRMHADHVPILAVTHR
jgi:peptidoglycan L-alanyl-D-glutamate endopeptidase CwlK